MIAWTAENVVGYLGIGILALIGLVALSFEVVGWFGGALAEAREKPGWVPGNVEPVVTGRFVWIDGAPWFTDTISPVAEAEALLREVDA